MIRAFFLSTAALVMAAPAVAQTAPAATPAPASAAMADPATLAEARNVAAEIMPPGTYKKIMSGTMSSVMDNFGETMKAMPLKQIAELGGLSPEEAKALDKVDLGRVMAIYDPHWQERTSLTMHAMFDAMGDFFTTLEPELREAVAHAYANQFTLAELTDLDHYFATPTGAKFASRSMTIMTDPSMMAEMKAMMPKMMAEMPHFLEAAQKATAGLPPPRKLEDLTPEQKADLAKALGVDPSKLKDPKATP
jgi:hypothetical protein